MTTNEVASILLSRCNKKGVLIVDAKMREAIGVEGFKHAIRRKWLVVDSAVGTISINDNATKLAEMRQVAQSNGQLITAVCAESTSRTRTLDLVHAKEMRHRQHLLSLPEAIVDYKPGDTVVIGEDGQQYRQRVLRVAWH